MFDAYIYPLQKKTENPGKKSRQNKTQGAREVILGIALCEEKDKPGWNIRLMFVRKRG